MKLTTLFLLAIGTALSFSNCSVDKAQANSLPGKLIDEQDRLLRHVVLFKFKETSSSEDIASVEAAFHGLPSKIPEIHTYEWGLNNSPEGLEKGFTHCFLLTFKSEEDRATYLPHPDHKAFGEVLDPHLEDVLVFDYWTN